MSSIFRITEKNFKYFIFLFSFFLFAAQLKNINQIMFDEVHYVPAAKEWQTLSPTFNSEHPPLAKYLIMAGIAAKGDNPEGWRIAPAISGALAIVFCYLIAFLIFQNFAFSSSVAFFTVFNYFVFIQSRIAMLDIFMVTFLLGGIYFYIKFMNKSKSTFNFYLSALFMGLAVAVKWSSILIYLPFFLIISVPKILSSSQKMTFLKSIRPFLLYGLFSVTIYFITFTPYLFITTADFSIFDILFDIPSKMLQQMGNPPPHPQNSHWYSWPFSQDPIRYFSGVDENQTFKVVMLIGNPFQMIIGLFSALYLFLNWTQIKNYSKIGLILFLSSWPGWALMPRNTGYLYYFLPASICFSFLTPMALTEKFEYSKAKKYMILITTVSGLVFLYFYPLLTGMAIPLDSLLGKSYGILTYYYN
jgi:dolichyl-phosphate-mannose--protein O-mannosyl transferase